MARRRRGDNEGNHNRYTLWVTLDQRQEIFKNRLPEELEGVYLRRILSQLNSTEEKPAIPSVPSSRGKDRTVPLSFRLDSQTSEFARQWHELMARQDMTLEQTLLLLLLWAVKISNPQPQIETKEELISFLKYGQTYGSLVPLSQVLEERLQGRIAVDRRANCPAKDLLWELHESGLIRLHTASAKHQVIKQRVKRYRIHDGKASSAYGHLEILPRATDIAISWSPLRRMIWEGDILPDFPFRITYRSETIGYGVPRSEIPLERVISIAVTTLNQEQFYRRWDDTKRLGTELDGILIRGFNGLNFTIISKEIL
jgi:hypothetical protein